MKNILGFVLLVVILSSCSSDSDNSTTIDESTIFLKKTITNHPDGTLVTANYHYNDTYITGITYSDGRNTAYEYENDLLVAIKEYDTNGELSKIEQYSYYDSINKTAAMLTTTYPEQASIYTTFSYYTGWLVEVNKYNVIGNGEFYFLSKIRTKLNGNGIYEASEYDENYDFLRQNTYIYDLKNNPLKNTASFDTQIIHKFWGSDHNILSYNKSGIGAGDSYTVKYTYNEANFPITGKKTLRNGDIINTEYFYE
ncbi:hypothetical protein [Flavobacterium litorale]|uniref:YD repeat-containing protein n=1 Tax=Flavobacterium litorale TaxID=2856519 RepID=A0ABX8VCU6_9FLAO|nr:hypothetical protein [Flavobacterium litorale]QYJ68499.1 hypothetical protein K1I41_01040 [Flavobacterium litorale]